MKKTFLSLLMLAGLSYAASAQTNQPIKIGVKAGVTFPTLATTGTDAEGDDWKMSTSFYAGGTVNIPLSEMFSIQPGLSLVGKGAKTEQSQSISEGGNTLSVNVSGKVNSMYLEVPLNLIANFDAGDGKLFIGAGPYYAMGIAGRIKASASATFNGESMSETRDEKIKYGSDSDANFKRGDFGVNFLAGYELSNGINIHAGYGLGLSNVSNENSSSFKASNRVLSVGLGFSF